MTPNVASVDAFAFLKHVNDTDAHRRARVEKGPLDRGRTAIEGKQRWMYVEATARLKAIKVHAGEDASEGSSHENM